jgi:hypothetical protein
MKFKNARKARGLEDGKFHCKAITVPLFQAAVFRV